MTHHPRTLVFLAAILLAASPLQADNRPNVVLIFTDDQGINDVGCYGSEIPTPHTDRIAAEGMKFTNWYSASSICTPSRYGLLTGKNPARSHDRLLSALMFLGDQQRGLRAGERTIAAALHDTGYATALIGKWHLGHGEESFLPVHHGFDVFKGHTGGCIDYFTMTYGIQPDWYEGTTHVSRNGYATELITDEAVTYLESRKTLEQPFFLYLAYNAPHFGKGWSPAKSETVNIMQPQAADLKRVEFIDDKIRREFAAMVVSLDDGIGRVLESLDDTGLANNTLVVFLTDHGGDPTYGGSNKPLRGDKATLFEGGIKVPCLMRWPGRIESGRVSDAVASSLDLVPTLCDLCDADLPDPGVDGVNLTAHLLRDRRVPDRTLYWETGSHAELNRGTWQAMRDGTLKYVKTPEGQEYVFDLSADPNEEQNLVADDPARSARLRSRAQSLANEYASSRK